MSLNIRPSYGIECESHKARKAFAVVSTVIMVLIAFQVLAGQSAGSVVDSPLLNSDDFGEEEFMLEDTISIDTGPYNTYTPGEPVTWDLPGGSVASYGGPPEPVISAAGEAGIDPILTFTDEALSVRTKTSLYTVETSRPEILALYNSNGALLVPSSYFSVDVGGVVLDVVNSQIAQMDDLVVVVLYDLVSPKDSSLEIARMEVSIDFSSAYSPKITAELVEIAPSVANWRIVWIIVPNFDARIVLSETKLSVPLATLVDEVVPAKNMSVEFIVDVDYFASEFKVDWSDAAEDPYLSVIEVDSTYALQVAFSYGRAVIDPTLVADSTSSAPTGETCQRKVVSYGGYYWVFYDRGDKICYRRSSDGQDWSSEHEIPDGTSVSSYGFDVYSRNNHLLLGWIDYQRTYAYFLTGVFLGSKIQWDERTSITGPGMVDAPVSVAIGTDGAYFAFLEWRELLPFFHGFSIFRMTDDTYWGTIVPEYQDPFSSSATTWNVILPCGDGDLALMETSGDSPDIRSRYWESEHGESGWTYPSVSPLGLAYNDGTGDAFSVVTSPDGRIHIAAYSTDGKLRYAVIDPSGSFYTYDLTSTPPIWGSPSISLDENGDLHIFWLDGPYTINHIQKVGSSIYDWSGIDTFYESTTEIDGLTSWNYPVGTHTLVWTELTWPRSVMFGSIPLPFGTPGAAAEPWNQDGLSPYQGYQSTFRDVVSPGSGLLTLLETDVSVPGLVGVDPSLSRIYQQPRYFRVSDGKPYMSYAFPDCNLGPGWSLDLPWMDDNYIYIGNGQRFLIQWGNNGNGDEFENHFGVHFVLRECHKWTPRETVHYYELMFSSGARYMFDYSSLKVDQITDLVGYDPADLDLTMATNAIYLSYGAEGLEYIEDDLDRRITFAYDANGMLETITRPDMEVITFTYSEVGGEYMLASVTQPLALETTFTYSPHGDESPYNYLLTEVEFPTGAKNVYAYDSDSPAGTEVTSWYVTQQKVVVADSGSLFRQRDYDYKIVSGDVRFVRITDRDESGVVQGYTENVYVSCLKYSSETKKAADGHQLSKVTTWYDVSGQPMRVDYCRGDSQDVSYSEYFEYDDWGNPIYSKDAYGHETYTSYANTITQNSFQGGNLLERTDSGRIFYDSFDDWDLSDWQTDLATGNSVSLDGDADPVQAPALKISHDVYGYARVYHNIGPQTEDFILQVSFMTSSGWPTYVAGQWGVSLAGSFTFYSSMGHFYWWDGSATMITEVDCVSNTWYDIAFHIHYETNTYDIYIDGEKVALDSTPTLVATTGPIEWVLFQSGDIPNYPSAQWIDNVRVYRSLEVSVNMAAFHDDFDDRCLEDWETNLADGNTISIDSTVVGSDAPALRISHAATGFAAVYHRIEAQSNDFVMQTSFMTDTWYPTYICGAYGGDLVKRLTFFSASGKFYWWDGAPHEIPEVACSVDTWYDIAFHIHYTSNSYEIYIDGKQVSISSTPNLVGSYGYIDRIYFQSGDIPTIPTTQWVDNVRVYRNPTLTAFSDTFDDWDISDWDSTTDGGTIAVEYYGGTDNPALKIERTNGAWLYTSHDLSPQSGDFAAQFSMMTNVANDHSAAYFNMYSAEDQRLGFRSYDGQFQYRNDVAWVDIGMPFSAGVRYDVSLVIVDASSVNIYINDYEVYLGARLLYSGDIDSIRLYLNGEDAGDEYWIDDIRVYTDLDLGYVFELFDSKGDLLDRSKNGILNIPAAPMNFPPGYIVTSQTGNRSFRTPMMDIWGGDVYVTDGGYYSSSIPKTAIGFGCKDGSVADEGFPEDAAYYGTSGDGDWITDPDHSVSGRMYHESRHYEESHFHGYLGVDTMYVPDTNVIVQYIWLTEGRLPQEIMLQFYFDDSWKRAYWGGGDGYPPEDLMVLPPAWEPAVGDVHRVGDVPYTTGSWLQLTISAEELGISGGATISGVAYGLYGGTARWDLTSTVNRGVNVSGLSPTQTVKLYYADNPYASGSSATQPVNLDTYAQGIKTYPVPAYFKILEGSTPVYTSPLIPEIYCGDEFEFCPSEWYPNEVKTDGGVVGFIHDRIVGAFQYQDYAETIPQETYVKYDGEGNAVETKSNLGSEWLVSHSGYDPFGNLIWFSDPAGCGGKLEYSSDYGYVYPTTIELGGPSVDTLETDEDWTAQKAGGGGVTSWLTAQYTDVESYSPDTSLEVSFGGASQGGLDYGYAGMFLEVAAKPIDAISLKYYVKLYSHNGASSSEQMDSGIKIRLFDSSGANYANYTYWLSCWSGTTDNSTAPDQYTKVIWGKPIIGSWIDVELHPLTDFASPPEWTNCAWVKLEIFVDMHWAISDVFKAYYDDISFFDALSGYGQVSYTYDINTGEMLSETDALGRTTSYEYDALGRQTSTYYPDGTGEHLHYDDSLPYRTVSYHEFPDEFPLQEYAYLDELNRVDYVVKVSVFYGPGHEMRYFYNWQDSVAAVIDGDFHTTEYDYDYLGRPVRITNPDTTYSEWTYDDASNLVTYVDENEHKTVYIYDYLGRHISTREFNSISSYYETTMKYDAVGNLLSVSDARLFTTYMIYDSLNRIVSATYPDGLSESQVYDDGGLPISKIDRSGRESVACYDSAGRLTRSVTVDETIYTIYDVAGQVVKKRNNLGSIEYEYDDCGRVTSLLQIIDGSSYSMAFSYDSGGRMTSMIYPDSTTLDFGYDEYQMPSSAVWGPAGSESWVNTHYRYWNGLLGSTDTSSGLQTSYDYNSRDMPSRIVTKLGTKTKLDLSYTYDDAGNVETIGGESYAYDHLNRITSATGAWGTIGYTYDEVGNRLTMDDDGVFTSYAYDDYNKLMSCTGWTFEYDDNGNTKRKLGTSEDYRYTYNSLNQMTDVEKWTYNARKDVWSLSENLEFRYDANGARASISDGSTTTQCVYLGHDMYFEKAGSVETLFVYIGGRLEAKIVGPDNYFYVQDALGSTRQVWMEGSTKAVYQVTTYKPFGIPVSPKGTEDFLYAGEFLEQEAGSSGLYYISARYMDPETGRWLSLDPELGKLSMPQVMNRYVYCVNNPLKFVDPDGRLPILVVAFFSWGGAALLGGGVAAGAISYIKRWHEAGDEPWSWKKLGAYSAAGLATGIYYLITKKSQSPQNAVDSIIDQIWGWETGPGLTASEFDDRMDSILIPPGRPILQNPIYRGIDPDNSRWYERILLAEWGRYAGEQIYDVGEGIWNFLTGSSLSDSVSRGGLAGIPSAPPVFGGAPLPSIGVGGVGFVGLNLGGVYYPSGGAYIPVGGCGGFFYI